MIKKKKPYQRDTYIKYRKFANEWVALTFDESRLLGHSSDLLRLHSTITKKEEYPDARFIHIPPPNTNFVF
ncbi:MAG: hypothetical protein AAB091_08200 [Elusimicrobiota bacterium]